MPLGPIQMLVLGFDEPNFHGQVLAEVDRLRQADTVRLVDLLVVRKRESGEVEVLQRSDLSPEEAAQFGAVVGALIGFGMMGPEGAEIAAEAGAEAMIEDPHILGEGAWYVEEAIPPGSAAAIALLEHRWAIPLREAILDAGGSLLADAWIHPRDLVAAGLLAAEEADALTARGE